MPSPLFDFFEMIAEELTLEDPRVLTEADFDAAGNDASVLDELRGELDVLTNVAAIPAAVTALQRHFEARGSVLPFTYDQPSGRFRATDKEYLKFVKEIREIRGQGKDSKTFELSVMGRIRHRVTGALHRVGHPREIHRRRPQFNVYLSGIGFNGNVLLGQEKDGGLDILWVLPMGGATHRPIVSVQCKNSTYSVRDGDESLGPVQRSLNQHKGLMSGVHVLCVLFNDYITADLLPGKAMQWVPLGLSDLGLLSGEVSMTAI